MASRRRARLAALGPGILFAATAVGVSHLVQATHAGAKLGGFAVALVLLAHGLKYPAFRFGHHYPAVTGHSLLQAYRQQGRGALVLYGLLTLGTMFTVQAAVTLVTVGLLLALLGIQMNPVGVAAVLLVLGSLFLAAGRFRALDRVTKLLVLVLSLATIAAAIAVAPQATAHLQWPGAEALSGAFLVALIGWMPSAPDVSVWQSLWVRARAEGAPLDPDAVRFDFHVGYLATFGLAVCFVALGAAVLSGAPELPATPNSFARTLMDAYASALGAWARPLIGVAAFAAMASTTLAVLDGFPRALAGLFLRWSRDEDPLEEDTGLAARAYWAALGLLALGALVVIALFLTSLRDLIVVATTLSFVTAPILCYLNHRAVFALPAEKRPSATLRWWSWLGIAGHLGLAGAYFWF